MAGLLDVLSSGEKLTKISIDDIRKNARNFYATVTESEDEDIYVENMASLIRENGQDSNGVVYEDTSIDDGKKYTLIAGERRFKAISLNKEKGVGDGMMDVKIIRKPDDEDSEILRLIENNSHRPKTKEIREAEIKELNEIWERMEINGTLPKGKKRDWIGKVIGMSPRQVQNYLTETKDIDGGNISTEEETESSTSKKEELTSSDKDQLLRIQENLEKYMASKVKVNQKNGSITFYGEKGVNALDNVYALLSFLGFDENGEKV